MFSLSFRHPTRKSQRGVGLIDVLLAVLVLGLGVLAVARLQAVAIKEGGGAKARGQAVQLAQEKIDDLRHFTQLESGTAAAYGFDEIGSNAGGTKNSGGNRLLPTGTVTLSNSNTTYTRTWTATGYYYCAAGEAPSTTNCTPAKTRPDYYDVSVKIDWTDQDGSARNVELSDSIFSRDPVDDALSLINGNISGPPIVTYTPGQAPEVLPIDIGDGKKKETTNPTPEVIRQGQEIVNVIARYETIKYNADRNTLEREQFTTLNCTCTHGTSNGTAFDVNGNQISKRIGTPTGQNQADECKICCRDHHDYKTTGDAKSCDPTTSAGKNNCFDPFRPSTDYRGDGDHNHYSASGQLANSGDYVEACRMKREDGLLRVVQDWRQIELAAIPESYFASGGTPNATNIANYGGYVRDFIKAEIKNITKPTPVWPTTRTLVKNNTDRLNARAIYLDYLDDTKTAAFTTRLNANDQTVFQEIPFYEVNLTKLAAWDVTDTTVLGVSNDPAVTELAGQNLYSRGVVTGKAAGGANAYTTTLKSNTGVIGRPNVDPDDQALRRDDVTYTVTLSTPPPVSISGAIRDGANNPISGASVSFTVTTPGGPCSFDSIGATYTCSVPAGWFGTITPSAPGFTFTPASITYTESVLTSLSNENYTAAGGATFTITGTITGPANAILAGVAVAASNLTNACTYNDSTGAYSCTVPSGFNGQVQPSKSGYTFSPAATDYSNVTGNFTNENYTATATSTTSYTISGTITVVGGASPSIITVPDISAGGFCTVNNSTSTVTYSCTVPTGWNGTIMPTSTTPVTFSPTSKTYSNVTANDSDENYTATLTTYTITGSIFLGSGLQSSDISAPSTTSGTCSLGTFSSSTWPYTCTVVSGSSPTVTPVGDSTVKFGPASRNYSNVTANQTSQNYNTCKKTTGRDCTVINATP